MRTVHGVAPTALTYNALLAACARTNDVARGCQLVDRMASERVAPDAGTVAAVASRKALRAYLRRAADGM